MHIAAMMQAEGVTAHDVTSHSNVTIYSGRSSRIFSRKI
jgi:hypothetical protein